MIWAALPDVLRAEMKTQWLQIQNGLGFKVNQMMFYKSKFFLYMLLTTFLVSHLQSLGATNIEQPIGQVSIYTIQNGEVTLEEKSKIKKDDFFPFVKRDLLAQHKPVHIAIPPPTEDELRPMNLKKCTFTLNLNAVCPAILHSTKLERNVTQTNTTAKTMSLLRWTPSSSGGLVASLNFKMEKAQGITLELLVKKIPDHALVRYSSDGDSNVAQVTGAEIKHRIASEHKNTENGKRVHGSLDSMRADNITLEFELPPNVRTDELEIAVPKVVSEHF